MLDRLRLDDIAGQRVDRAGLVVARVLLGIAALLQLIDSAPVLLALAQPDAFRVPMISWLPLATGPLLYGLLVAWLLATGAFIVGKRTGLSGAALVLILSYLIVVDQQTYSNHVYLVVIAIALLAVADRPGQLVPAWPLFLIRVQLSIVYFFAAVAKVNAVYLSGAVIAPNLKASWLLPVPESWVRWELMLPVALGSVLFELFLALAFWSPRYRRVALLTGVGFHMLIIVTYPASSILPLTVFALVMYAMYAQWVDPRSLRTIASVWRERLPTRRVAAQRQL